MTLSGFARVQATEGKYFSAIQPISPEEAGQIKNEMSVTQTQEEPSETSSVEKTEAKEEKGTTDQTPATETAAPLLNVQQEIVPQSEDELIENESIIELNQQTQIDDIVENVVESAAEVKKIDTVEIISELPPLPSTPEL